MAKQEEELSQDDCNKQKKFTMPKFGSLKDILEELYKLQESDFKRTVFGHLKDGLTTYCGETYLNAFYGVQGGGNSSGSIQAVTYAGYDTCRQLVKTPPGDGRSVNIHAKHDDCIQKYAEALKKCLPKAFSALYYLYFMCSTDCKSMHGGHWSSYKVNESGRSGQNLYKWLIGDSGSDFIDRGFSQEDLHKSNNGSMLVEQLKSAVSLTLGQYEGALQKVLCGLMFSCPWDDSLLGHACLFLHKFCSEVETDSGNAFRGEFEEKYSGKKYDELKELCRTLKSQLDSLVNGTQGGLSAVCHGNTDLFKDLWDDGKFDKYCDWLKRNVYRIIQSLKNMPMESSQWSSDHLMSGSSAGPFKYGFVFKASWKASTSGSKLQTDISKLTGSDSGSLNELKKALEPSSSSALTTAAGAAGGLFGLGGAGAGAAYATNAFGLKDIISGLISGFLK
ncbi:secreted antigen 3 [Babesia divergens]|uniref:Secreted antigen 3 n=1 Tax=Babesia divergens TaxID=32595 RepID=A0AAD9G9J0_BABDI|nr:secreted antigen 3 [Babesia divergens]